MRGQAETWTRRHDNGLADVIDWNISPEWQMGDVWMWEGHEQDGWETGWVDEQRIRVDVPRLRRGAYEFICRQEDGQAEDWIRG